MNSHVLDHSEHEISINHPHRFLLCPVLLFAQAPAKRVLTADDFYRVQQVRDPQVSPDGAWIAYTVTSADIA